MSPTSIAAYLVLFGSIGLLFLLVSLLLGRLLRPDARTVSKLDVYECGEPAVGSSFVQFDLRFYVVALMFIVFEVELALFFPPATIFGTATRWMKPQTSPDVSSSLDDELGSKQEPAPPPALSSGNTASARSIRLHFSRTTGRKPTRRRGTQQVSPSRGCRVGGRLRAGPYRGRRPGRVFRFDFAWLRLPLAAGRSQLGPRHR